MLNQTHIDYLSKNLRFFNKLTPEQKKEVQETAVSIPYNKGEMLYGGSSECLGLVLIEEGQFRVFIDNDGKQITLYRLLPLDICIFSASCSIKNINFELNIEIEKDSRVFLIPSMLFEKLNRENTFVKDFTLDLVSERFSEVMWVFNQYVFSSAASRLANFLIELSALQASDTLNITHEAIANDLGTAREVITRLLKHFASDKAVSLGRSSIKIENMKKLKQLR